MAFVQKIDVKHAAGITLKGSAEIVVKFFEYGINSILFQRGIYPPEFFKRSFDYEVPLLLIEEAEIKNLVQIYLTHIKELLIQKKINKLKLVFKNEKTEEPFEIWEFNIVFEDSDSNNQKNKEDALKEIQKGIRSVLRQVVAAVSFLPLLQSICTFDIHLYTSTDVEIPINWNETKPSDIENAQKVDLNEFSTTVHKVYTSVSYKLQD